MKISQLIKELEEIRAEHGDIPVATSDRDGEWECFVNPHVVESACWDYKDPDLKYKVRTVLKLSNE